MRKLLLPLIIFFLLAKVTSGQNGKFEGKPVIEIFTDFHLNIDDTSKTSGFALNRAYFGYQFMPEGKFYARVVFNVGSPDDLTAGSVHHRYAFFREASIDWSDERLTVSMGIINTKLYEFQQLFWGKRYVANTYQSLNGYGFVADLGLSASYKFNEIFQGDLIVTNGEGYNDLQVDNNIRTSLGLTITPSKTIAIRLFGDIQKKDGLWQPMLITFIGFKNDLITIGGEVSYKSNLDLIRGHHSWGISATGGYNLSEKTQIFSRFDYSTSVIVPGEQVPWNIMKDGRFLIGGVQYTFNPNVKAALDYQGIFPHSNSINPTDMIYLNASFKF